jgi:hypothetical protein
LFCGDEIQAFLINPPHRVAEVMLGDEIGERGKLVGEVLQFRAVGWGC